LRVVGAQPKDRYLVLQDFIAVPGVQKCESALRDALKAVERELNDAVVAKQQAEDTLEKLWKAEGGTGSGYLEWAKEKVKDKPLDLEAIVSVAHQILTALGNAVAARNQLNTDKLEQSKCEVKRQEVQRALEEAKEGKTAQGSTLITVLQDAKTFLEGHESASECPVCEQSIDVKKLGQRISERLAELSDIVTLKMRVEAAQREAHNTATAVSRSRKRLVELVRKLGTTAQQCSFAEIASLTIDWTL